MPSSLNSELRDDLVLPSIARSADDFSLVPYLPRLESFDLKVVSVVMVTSSPRFSSSVQPSVSVEDLESPPPYVSIVSRKVVPSWVEVVVETASEV